MSDGEAALFQRIRKAVAMLDEAIENANIPTWQAPELAVRLNAVRHVLITAAEARGGKDVGK